MLHKRSQLQPSSEKYIKFNRNKNEWESKKKYLRTKKLAEKRIFCRSFGLFFPALWIRVSYIASIIIEHRSHLLFTKHSNTEHFNTTQKTKYRAKTSIFKSYNFEFSRLEILTKSYLSQEKKTFLTWSRKSVDKNWYYRSPPCVIALKWFSIDNSQTNKEKKWKGNEISWMEKNTL